MLIIKYAVNAADPIVWPVSPCPLSLQCEASTPTQQELNTDFLNG